MEILSDDLNTHNNILDLIPLLKEKLNMFTKTLESDRNIDESSLRFESKSYKNLSQEFISEYASKTEYIQYSRTYFNRLTEIKPNLVKLASDKWRSYKICDNILDMRGKETQVIFGILYKEMPLKPSILKGIESIFGSKKVESFVNQAEDYLIIEDTSGRIRVSNSSPMKDFSSGNYTTGLITSIRGKLDDRGLFLIEDILFYKVENYSLPPKIRNSVLKEDSLTKNSSGTSIFNMLGSNNNLIAFISGLHIGKVDHSGKLALARNLLIDLLQGRFTTESNVNRLIKRVNRFIIAGNSIDSPDDTDLVEKGSYLKADLNSRVYKTLLQNFDVCDNFLNTLSYSLRVDVMPGTDDNSSSFFPQLPINPVMLPICCNNSTVNLVSNPYKFELDDVQFLGTSGQNVDNIRRYTTVGPDALEILEKTLDWCHISPSAPDTLRSYPVMEADPLLLKEIPNVYFVGNQTQFGTKTSFYNGVPLRLISLPDFSKTFSFVLMDMNTLEACEYQIGLNN